MRSKQPPYMCIEAIRQCDNVRVLIKFLQSPADNLALTSLKNEYKLLQGMAIPGVIRLIGFEELDIGYGLIYFRSGDKSLEDLIYSESINLERFLNIAIHLTDTLGQLHSNGIVLNNLTPGTIFVESTTDEILISDLSSVSRHREQQPDLLDYLPLEGPLYYISPEQTGRMNRTIDYRSDIYTLGVILYEMLTGQVPFQSPDSIGLIHAHIAKLPRPITQLNPEIPAVIEQIVLRCLEKNAADRYQNCFGIMQDFKQCLGMLSTLGKISSFEISQKDIPLHFNPPQCLLGRDRELALLNTAMDKTISGKRILAIVEGAPGVGKTFLISETHRHASKIRSWFITGKCDEMNINTPYYAWIQAIQGLIHILLTEQEAILEMLKNRILSELGDNCRILIDLVPDFEYILGPQPDLPSLSAGERHNRFVVVFRKFIQIIAQPQHPLIIHLDDLQWSDNPTTLLIQSILKDTAINQTMIIGSMRSIETEATTFVKHLLTQSNSNTSTVHITLNNLKPAHIREIIEHTIRQTPKWLPALSDIIFTKTNGNPYFIFEFLNTLHDEHLLYLDSNDEWVCRLETIIPLQITENVVDLLLRKIKRFPAQLQSILKTLATLGYRSPYRFLEIVIDTPSDILEDSLKLLIDEGMLIKTGHILTFTHSRLQEACYGLIETADRSRFHYQLAVRLSQEFSLEERDRYAPEIVRNYNFGLQEVTSQDERLTLAQLNYKVGIRFQSAAGFDPALTHFRVAHSLLPENAWEHHYDLKYSLSLNAMESAYFCRQYDEMMSYFSDAIAHITNSQDKLPFYEIRIKSLWTQNRLKESIEIGHEGLRLLNFTIKTHPTKLDTLFEFLRIRFMIWGSDLHRLLLRDRIEKPEYRAIIHILSLIGSAIYWTRPEIFPYYMLRRGRIAMQKGESRNSAHIYCPVGLIFCASGAIDIGYSFGTLSLELLKNSPTRIYDSRTLFLFHCFISIWKKHIRSTHNDLKRGYQIGLDTGDLEYAGHNLMAYACHGFMITSNYEKTSEQLTQMVEQLHNIHQEIQVLFLSIVLQTCLTLCGKTTSYKQFEGPAFIETEQQRMINHTHNLPTRFVLHLYKLQIFCIMRDYTGALQSAEAGRPLRRAQMGTLHFSLFIFYDSLAALFAWETLSQAEQRYYRKRIHKNRLQFKHWMRFCPENHAHKYFLLTAEGFRITKKFAQAESFYIQAIEAADKDGFLCEKAIACECFGIYFHSRQQLAMARSFLNQSYQTWSLLGATIKTEQMEQQWPIYITPLRHRMSDEIFLNLLNSGNRTQITIDQSSLFKAAQSLSREIEIHPLLEKLMDNILEYAGAQKGVLILSRESNQQLYIEAISSVQSSQRIIMKSIPLTHYPHIAQAIVLYAHRTKEPVIIADATSDERFQNDHFVISEQPKSIMCVPITNKMAIIGLIYLENNLSADAFNAHHLAVTQFLAGQAAIAIENALLYSRMVQLNQVLEDRVREKTEAFKIAKEEAESANRFKSLFLAQITHDLRTPLHIILGVLDMVIKNPIIKNHPEIKSPLDVVIKSGERQMTLVNDILDLSRLKTGSLEINSLEFTLTSLIQEIEDFMHTIVDSKCISFHIHNAFPADQTIFSDPHRIMQIVSNLISTSIKHSQEGAIRIEFDRSDQTFFTIAISNTGTFQFQKSAAYIYNEFHPNTTDLIHSMDNSGLRLTIARTLTDALGGTIDVSTDDENGNLSFLLTLPCINIYADKAPASPNQLAARQGLLADKRILICDSDSRSRQLCGKILETACQLTLVSTASETLEKLAETMFDLILLDMTLSGEMDTLQLLRRIREYHTTPVIAMSTQHLNGYAQVLQGHGFVTHINKPVIEYDLLNTIHTVLFQGSEIPLTYIHRDAETESS